MDYAEALRWFQKAADQGNTSAQLAADQGLAEAQAALGSMYGLGNGVPKDFVRADAWLILASGCGGCA